MEQMSSPVLSESGIEQVDPMVILLDKYRTRLLSGSLSKDEQLLLAELSIKDELLANSSTKQPTKDEDCLKYLFLGYYIYNHILTE
jgi:hypothetical protein